MGLAHTMVGITGAAAIVLGAVWAAWPVASPDASGGTSIGFPYLVHGSVTLVAGLGAALWAMGRARHDAADAVAPPPRR